MRTDSSVESRYLSTVTQVWSLDVTFFLSFKSSQILSLNADPSSDELKRIMMMNGGTFHHYFNSKKTTHIIATNLPDVKVTPMPDPQLCTM